MAASLMITLMAVLSAVVLAIHIPSTTSSPLVLKKSNHIFMVSEKGNDLIESTCKQTPNYQLCISTLRSDPRSFETDVYGLGLVLVDALKAKATSAVDIIERLRGSNPESSVALIECGILYNAILKADVPVAVDALTKGIPKFAEDGMDDAALEVTICEDSFKQTISPMTDMNKDVYDLSVVAKFVIRILL